MRAAEVQQLGLLAARAAGLAQPVLPSSSSGAAAGLQACLPCPEMTLAPPPFLPPSWSSGERFAGSSDPAVRAAAAAIKATTEEEMAEKRRAKKAAFDAEYDTGGWLGFECVM